MAKEDEEYHIYIVQTYRHTGGGSSKSIRARPAEGQGLDASMKVECSSTMRNSHPVGTYFRIRAKVTDREGGPAFLYTNFNWKYSVVTQDEAKSFIKSTFG
jgi:hypothetical protein